MSASLAMRARELLDSLTTHIDAHEAHANLYPHFEQQVTRDLSALVDTLDHSCSALVANRIRWIGAEHDQNQK